MFVCNILCLRVKTHWSLILFTLDCCVLLLKLLYHGIVFLQVIAVVHWSFLHNIALWKLIIFLFNSQQMFFKFSIVLIEGSWWVWSLDLNGCWVVGSTTTLYVWLRSVHVLSILGWSPFERGICWSFVFGTYVTFNFSDIFHRIYLGKLFLFLKARAILGLSRHNT